MTPCEQLHRLLDELEEARCDYRRRPEWSQTDLGIGDRALQSCTPYILWSPVCRDHNARILVQWRRAGGHLSPSFSHANIDAQY
jgi:hypothetical protein